MKTSELIGAALDWAVTYAQEVQFAETRIVKICRQELSSPAWIEIETDVGTYVYQRFSPSTDWAQAGPIIEREGITIIRANDDWGKDAKGFCNNVRIPVWAAAKGQFNICTTTEYESHDPMFQIDEDCVTYGPTPLIAAMRCYVASKLGNEVEILEELQ